MQEDLLKERALLEKICQYLGYARKRNMTKLQMLEPDLFEDLKSYFNINFVSIYNLLNYKEILEKKLKENQIPEKQMVSLFYSWFDGVFLDKHFDDSWKALWEYANENKIYEVKDFKKDRFALTNLRNLILKITKKAKKNEPITYKETEYLIYYEACFKDIDVINIEIAIAFFASFNIYYRGTTRKNPDELSMLEKIHYTEEFAKTFLQENNLKVVRNKQQ